MGPNIVNKFILGDLISTNPFECQSLGCEITRTAGECNEEKEKCYRNVKHRLAVCSCCLVSVFFANQFLLWIG